VKQYMSEQIKQIATDVPGCEGPIFDLTGRFFVVSPPAGQILQIDLDRGEAREHANTGGIPAGLQVDRENNLWVADMKLGILKLAPDGKVSDVVRTYKGKPIRGCNDCAFDSKGNLYFTAPAGSNKNTPVGEVYCREVDGNVHRLDNGYAFSNGIAVNADDRLLIVAETFTKSLWAYDILAPGKISNKRLFARLPGDDEGGPDGLDFDRDGYLLAAHWQGSSIDVFDANGGVSERIKLPFTNPSNIHFGGAEGNDLYITDLGNSSVWQMRWRGAGLVS